MGLETVLFDESTPSNDLNRQQIVNTLCDDDMASNFEDILDTAPLDFLNDLYLYATENLIKMHLFISTPFATEYSRYIETTRISFIANVGGKC